MNAVSSVWVNISSTAQHTRGGLLSRALFSAGIGVDAVYNHAVRLLVVEHGADVVFGKFRIEFWQVAALKRQVSQAQNPTK